MLKLRRVSKVEVPFLVLVYVFNLLFVFSAVILEKGLFQEVAYKVSFKLVHLLCEI